MIATVEGVPSGAMGFATGRGTGALIAAVKALELAGREVLVPVNLCAIAVAGLIAVGVRPVLHDVSADTGNATLEQLKAAWRPSVAGLLAVHNFGQPLGIDSIADWARQRELALIEDNCNALGASWNGAPLGTLGDVAIYSFGAGKIADAGEGGVVTANNLSTATNLRSAVEEMPVLDDAVRAAGAEMEGRLRHLRTSGAPLAAQRDAYLGYEPHMATRLGAGGAKRIEGMLAKLGDNVARRRRMAILWNKYLASAKVERSPVAEGAAPWRYNIRVDAKIRDGLVQDLRAHGHSASTWYPPIDTMFAGEIETSGEYLGARAFAAQVINLWVDQGVSEEKIRAASELIARHTDTRA
ncbi:DegT/DnrJ/EryC1/StrS family aminotransferase [Bradyrhizobium sp. TZ2]